MRFSAVLFRPETQPVAMPLVHNEIMKKPWLFLAALGHSLTFLDTPERSWALLEVLATASRDWPLLGFPGRSMPLLGVLGRSWPLLVALGRS